MQFLLSECCEFLMKSFPVISVSEWLLRQFQHDDLDLIKKASADPLIPLITTIPAIYSEQAAQEYIGRQNERHIIGKGYSFAIAFKETDISVGSVFVGLNPNDFERATLGYWIFQEYRGSRVLSKILPSLIEWVWKELNIIRLELYVEPWNTGSIKIAESLGFQKEGLMRSWQKVGDSRKDMYMFSLLEPSVSRIYDRL